MDSRFGVLTLMVLVALSGLGQGQAHAYGNDFSCPVGTDGACLSFGEVVCRSGAKCVEQSATCFSTYTCGLSNEFVCKSDFEDLASSCRRLQTDHEELSSNNERLRNACTDLQSDYNTLVDEIERIRQTHSNLLRCLASSRDSSSCINQAPTGQSP